MGSQHNDKPASKIISTILLGMAIFIVTIVALLFLDVANDTTGWAGFGLLLLLVNPVTLILLLILLPVFIYLTRREGHKASPSRLRRAPLIILATVLSFILLLALLIVGSYLIFQPGHSTV
jgi:amino acid transporter